MEDLTGRFMSNLVPSSMSAGNTVSDDPKLSMTAPGSPSVLPVPERLDNLPLPQFTPGKIPVSHPGNRDKVETSTSSHGGGTFDTIVIGGVWKER